MRSRTALISVPLPTPEGPVITKTAATTADSYRRRGGSASPQEGDELGALPDREPADRLRRRDPALVENPVDLDAPVLRDGQHHVEDLGGLQVLGRVEEQALDRDLAGLEITLQLRPPRADLIRRLECPHALVVAARGDGCRGRGGGCHRRGDHIHGSAPRNGICRFLPEFASSSGRGGACRLDGRRRDRGNYGLPPAT